MSRTIERSKELLEARRSERDRTIRTELEAENITLRNRIELYEVTIIQFLNSLRGPQCQETWEAAIDTGLDRLEEVLQ